jgi:TetR/AcrR family transcriptional repressor of nem operon
MARHREFVPEDALRAAMHCFWRKGYDATSIADLVEATGVARQSLYNTFGDKHELYLQALARYDRDVDALLAPLLADGAGLDAIRGYVEHALETQRRARCTGCLIARSALEVGDRDKAVRTVVETAARRVRAALESAVESARERGEIASTRAPAELANYLFGVLNGLAALIATGASTDEVRRVVDLTLDSLRAA